MSWLDDIRFNDDGLIPVIAQDAKSGKVLMLAWMTRESLQLTAEKGEAVYWSRSRQKLWHKGEESGHQQQIAAVLVEHFVRLRISGIGLGIIDDLVDPGDVTRWPEPC